MQETDNKNDKKASYKKALLKSGLPFEYEVCNYLRKNGFIVDFEYPYIKDDENGSQKEFSYDLAASYSTIGHYLDFQIECKYKMEPDTIWCFLSNETAYMQDINSTSFIHEVDAFSDKRDLLHHTSDFPSLAPICTKGVEIYSKDQANEKTIVQAAYQLSDSFTEKIIDDFYHEINLLLGTDTIFYQIPVIVTNANLYLLKTDITTDEIKQSENIESIAQNHSILLYTPHIDLIQRNNNFQNLYSFLSALPQKTIKDKFKTFTNDIHHFSEVQSELPRLIAIVHWDKEGKNLQEVIDYVKKYVWPTQEIKDMLGEKAREREKHVANFLKKK